MLDWIGGLAQAVIAGVLAEIINDTLREAKHKRLADKARHARRGEQIAARGRRIESELREFTGAAVSLKWYGEWVSLVDEGGRKVVQIVD